MVLRTQRNAGRVAQNSTIPSRRSAATQQASKVKRARLSALALSPFLILLACGGSTNNGGSTGLDGDNNKLADDLGRFVDANRDGIADSIDINHDGKADGPEVVATVNGKDVVGLALDVDCDGIFDAIDTNGDGLPDLETSREHVTLKPCFTNPVAGGGSGSGGASGMAGSPGMGGSTSMGGKPGMGGSGNAGSSHGGGGSIAGSTGMAGAGTAGGNSGSELGHGTYQGSGSSTDRYAEDDLYRNGVGYKFIANGWGTGWQSHNITWNGTSFVVASLNGSQGSDYSPAGYPTVFCGLYSKKQSIDKCGLPATISALKSVKTGWRWKANGNNGQYNAAWDIWLSEDGQNISSYLMVWLRDPPGQQPAGSAALAGATVKGLPGTWSMWRGTVMGHPIVNYVQPEGHDLSELEFDVLDVYRDAIGRPGVSLPGSKILAVAVGFEVWNGPITNLVNEDFYVDVK